MPLHLFAPSCCVLLRQPLKLAFAIWCGHYVYASPCNPLSSLGGQWSKENVSNGTRQEQVRPGRMRLKDPLSRSFSDSRSHRTLCCLQHPNFSSITTFSSRWPSLSYSWGHASETRLARELHDTLDRCQQTVTSLHCGGQLTVLDAKQLAQHASTRSLWKERGGHKLPGAIGHQLGCAG